MILGFRTITFFIGGFIPGRVGTTIAVVGVILSWIAPAFTGKYTRHRPIIFSHLLERLTALIIMMFGETIVGIADYFTEQNFSIYSLLIFISVVGLFFTYILEFDHLIDEDQTQQTGNLLIYLHYFILFGISLFTVSLKFISEPDANPIFAASRLFAGIALVYIGLGLANRYNRIPVSGKLMATFAVTTIVGYLCNLHWHTFPGFVITSTVVIIVNAAILTYYKTVHE